MSEEKSARKRSEAEEPSPCFRKRSEAEEPSPCFEEPSPCFRKRSEAEEPSPCFPCFSGFLEYLSAECNLVGPVDTGKVIEYRVAAASDILMDDRISYKSIKEYFFPQTELMFTFENGEVLDNTELPGFVIFGARPCDLEALRVMSTVYTTGKYADPFFKRRFDANFLIGIGCISKKPECFCDEMGIDPGFSDFCDIMLVDGGDCYFASYLSEKGRQALAGYNATIGGDCGSTGDFGGAGDCDGEKKAAAPDGSRLMLGVGREDADFFDVIDWEKVTETCRGCGICTYICPTCYCFDFKDVSKKGEAKRFKCWDSCMYPKFTLHASGHNPRDKRFERYRQRVLHKYKYVPENFDGCIACTGCGRCVRSCPVGINIKDIVKQVMEVI